MIRVAKVCFRGSSREYTYLVPDYMEEVLKFDVAIVETARGFSKVGVKETLEVESISELALPEYVGENLKSLHVLYEDAMNLFEIWRHHADKEQKDSAEELLVDAFGEDFADILELLEGQ